MSMLNRLSILGVRSFDNTRSETIVFRPPLTLIVGPNGSGKTTIIECLKYVTTGQIPGGAQKGSDWVHDPKLCGEKEVLAQIKLSFDSTQGGRMVCTRNLQLTVSGRANKRSCKALEGNMLMSRDGQKITVSSRVAELDSQMPIYLGASKAVLESVIFCHQEDSLWPMSDAKTLKGRFDEIFEALKYTKAIDTIKVLQKQQRDYLVVKKKDEEHTKHIKIKAEQNQKRATQVSDEIDRLKGQSEELGLKMREAEQKSHEALKKRDSAGVIVGQLQGRRVEEETKEESVRSLREAITEMTDSDEELQSLLEQYDERVAAHEKDLDQQKAQYFQVDEELKQARERVSAKGRECGTHEALKKTYDHQVEERERLVKETARSHSIAGFNMEVDHEQVKEFIDRISKMARDQNVAFERAKRETQEELQRAQNALNQINEQKSALNQRKENSRSTIATNDTKINVLQNDLNKINLDEGSKAALESKLRETETELDRAKSAIGSANWDSSIESTESEIRQLEDRKEKLEGELVEGTKQATDSARLDFVRKELKEREGSLETMTGAHGEKVTSIVGQGWTAASLESDFQRALQKHSSSVEDATKQYDGTNRELEQVEFQLKKCRDELKTKRDARKTAENTIRKAMSIEPADYTETVEEIEQSRDVAKFNAEGATQLLAFFEACIKNAKEHNGCMTCVRTFNTPQERDKMLNFLDKEKKKRQSGEEQQKELDDLENELETAKKVAPQFETWERLNKKELPALESSESELADKRQGLLRQLEEHDNNLKDRQGVKRDVEAISKTVQNISKYHNEISNFEQQIKELAAKQKASGLSRGLEIVREEIKQVNQDLHNARSRLKKSEGDRDRSKTQINTLELEYRDVKSKLSDAEYQLKEKRSLNMQIEDLKKTISEQRESIKAIDHDLQGLVPKSSQAQEKYDDIVHRGEERDRNLQAEKNKLDSSISELRKADRDVKAYLDNGGPEQLQRVQREYQNAEAEVARMEQELKEITRAVKNLQDRLTNHQGTKRSIADNQRYRRDLKHLNEVREEIQRLESHNAEEDRAYWDREYNMNQLQFHKHNKEQSGLIGQMTSLDNQLKQLMQDYETEYKDAGKKQKAAHILVETTKACVEDLGRYMGALDKAIMKYHSLKMEEINRIVQDLWRNTYQGTDVDTIMIRSESENVKANKSYNYRVVMVKQDAEMDMRGRCSAGQKVLASIIIRLALAECFGKHCGVIALDEPTTNLDRDNIVALAKSLNMIIKQRRHQANFQLVVITHDEDFLREMQCGEFAEWYWRVSRNGKQKSIIERQSINQVV